MSAHRELPAYTAPDLKAALLAAGASGTIYALVMPESEAALEAVIDDRPALLNLYREPWTQKQDAMHRAFFDAWIDWSAPVVAFDPAAFPCRYPTAGASEGIFKLMAEYAADRRARGLSTSIHLFDGDYEGFPAFAESLHLPVVRHQRGTWRAAAAAVDSDGQFWISQPSAIDGMVWPHFAAFAEALHREQPTAELIPDLTYVGSVARAFTVAVDLPNVPAFVFSHSKPFGGYYHRVGGVFARSESRSLFGNIWFKNLLSLAWGTEMMRRHPVFDLPRRYRPVQEDAARRVGTALGVDLAPADIMLMATAPSRDDQSVLLRAVRRGSSGEQVVRLCLTAAMTALINPNMAPATAPSLLARWADAP